MAAEAALAATRLAFAPLPTSPLPREDTTNGLTWKVGMRATSAEPEGFVGIEEELEGEEV